MKKAVYFDLDGTISDSAPGIMNAIVYLQQKEKLRELSESELRACIGPPLSMRFSELWGVDFDTAEKYLDIYREYYTPKGIFENNVYDGIPEVLIRLCESGYELRICSAKPEVMVHTVLEHFGIEKYFSVIIGAPLHGKFPGKSEAIKSTLQKSPASAVMVGDRRDDMLGARGAGIIGIGALWGYGSREELIEAGADVLVASPSELFEAIKQFN